MLKTKKRNWLLTLGTIFAILFAVIGGVLMFGTRSALVDPAHSDSPAVVKADEPATSGNCGENVTWSYDAESQTLTISGTGAMANYTSSSRPSYEADYRTYIKHVVIGNGVTSIGNYAFYGGSNSLAYNSLDSVTLGDDVETIGTYVFYRSNLNTIKINDNLVSIGTYAFPSWSLKNLYIGDLKTWFNVSTSGTFSRISAENIYVNNVLLETLELDNDITTIPGKSFQGCLSLKTVIIPETLTSVGGDAFSGCDNVSAVYITDLIKYVNINLGYNSFFGNRAEVRKLYLNGVELTNLTLDKSMNNNVVINISGHFQNCTSLQTVNLNGCDVKDYAFQSCINLTSVDIDDTDFERWAFQSCTSLKNVTLRENITYMGRENFYGCSAIENIYYYPATINSSSYARFSGAGNPEKLKLYIKSTVQTLPGFSGLRVKEVIFENNQTTIDTGMFSSCSYLEKVVLPETVTSIGQNAFYNCTSLSDINLDDSVIIEADSFKNCSSLFWTDETSKINYMKTNSNNYFAVVGVADKTRTTYIVNNNTKYILPEAFSDCVEATSISIPSTVNRIFDNVFQNCTKLENVGYTKTVENKYSYVDGVLTILSVDAMVDNPQWYQDGINQMIRSIVFPAGNIQKIGTNSFKDAKLLSSITISSNIGSIASNAFQNCVGLTSVTFENGLTGIGASAFISCSSIQTIVLPGSVDSIGSNAFQNCGSLTSFTAQSGLTSIGANAFNGCSNLGTIVLPSSLNSIGSNAFAACKHITSITYSKEVENVYRFEDGTLTILSATELAKTSPAWYTANINPLVKTVVLPNDITTCGQYAFTGMYNLESTVFEKIVENKYSYENGTLTVLSNDGTTQWRNDNLANVTLHVDFAEGVTTIPANAFKDFTSLKTVTIPAGITSIGNSAFSGCTALETIYFNATNCANLSNTNNAFLNAGNNSDGVTVVFGDDVTRVPGLLFGYYSSGNSSYTYQNNIKTLKFGQNIATFGGGAFYCSRNITNIYITNLQGWQSITCESKIGNTTFSGAEYVMRPFYSSTAEVRNLYINNELVTEYTFPSDVTTIGAYAFYKFNNTVFTIPSTVTSVDWTAFTGVKGVNATIGTVNWSWNDVNKTLTVSGTGEIPNYQNTSTAANRAPWYVFAQTMEHVIVESGITRIGNYAFGGSSGQGSYSPKMIDVDVADTVTYIGDGAFYIYNSSGSTNYDSLTSLTIRGTGVTFGGKYWIQNRSKITDIHLTKNVAGSWRYDDGKLTIYQTSYGEPGWYLQGFNRIIFEVEFVGNNFKKIGTHSFWMASRLESITIPEGVESIGYEAFAYSNLKQINLPSTLKAIGQSAFYSVPNDMFYITESGDKYIARGTNNYFALIEIANDCEELIISDNVQVIAERALSKCRSIKKLTGPVFRVYAVTGESGAWGGAIFQHILYLFETGDFKIYDIVHDGDRWYKNGYMPSSLEEVIVTQGTEVPGGFFQNCAHIKKVSLCEGIVKIGKAYRTAFYDCTGLEELICPSTLTTIEGGAIGYCPALKNAKNLYKGCYYTSDNYRVLYAGDENATEVEIHPNTICITNGAFDDCRSITSVKYSVTTDDFIFENGRFMLTTNNYYNNSFGSNGNTDSRPWYQIKNLILSVDFDGNVRAVPKYAFKDCYNLQEVTIHDDISEIGEYAFIDCSKLENVYLGKGVEYVGIQAFYAETETTLHIWISAKAKDFGVSLNPGRDYTPMFNELVSILNKILSDDFDEEDDEALLSLISSSDYEYFYNNLFNDSDPVYMIMSRVLGSSSNNLSNAIRNGNVSEITQILQRNWGYSETDAKTMAKRLNSAYTALQSLDLDKLAHALDSESYMALNDLQNASGMPAEQLAVEYYVYDYLNYGFCNPGDDERLATYLKAHHNSLSDVTNFITQLDFDFESMSETHAKKLIALYEAFVAKNTAKVALLMYPDVYSVAEEMLAQTAGADPARVAVEYAFGSENDNNKNLLIDNISNKKALAGIIRDSLNDFCTNTYPEAYFYAERLMNLHQALVAGDADLVALVISSDAGEIADELLEKLNGKSAEVLAMEYIDCPYLWPFNDYPEAKIQAAKILKDNYSANSNADLIKEFAKVFGVSQNDRQLTDYIERLTKLYEAIQTGSAAKIALAINDDPVYMAKDLLKIKNGQTAAQIAVEYYFERDLDAETMAELVAVMNQQYATEDERKAAAMEYMKDYMTERYISGDDGSVQNSANQILRDYDKYGSTDFLDDYDFYYGNTTRDAIAALLTSNDSEKAQKILEIVANDYAMGYAVNAINLGLYPLYTAILSSNQYRILEVINSGSFRTADDLLIKLNGMSADEAAIYFVFNYTEDYNFSDEVLQQIKSKLSNRSQLVTYLKGIYKTDEYNTYSYGDAYDIVDGCDDWYGWYDNDEDVIDAIEAVLDNNSLSNEEKFEAILEIDASFYVDYDLTYLYNLITALQTVGENEPETAVETVLTNWMYGQNYSNNVEYLLGLLEPKDAELIAVEYRYSQYNYSDDTYAALANGLKTSQEAFAAALIDVYKTYECNNNGNAINYSCNLVNTFRNNGNTKFLTNGWLDSGTVRDAVKTYLDGLDTTNYDDTDWDNLANYILENYVAQLYANWDADGNYDYLNNMYVELSKPNVSRDTLAMGIADDRAKNTVQDMLDALTPKSAALAAILGWFNYSYDGLIEDYGATHVNALIAALEAYDKDDPAKVSAFLSAVEQFDIDDDITDGTGWYLETAEILANIYLELNKPNPSVDTLAEIIVANWDVMETAEEIVTEMNDKLSAIDVVTYYLEEIDNLNLSVDFATDEARSAFLETLSANINSVANLQTELELSESDATKLNGLYLALTAQTVDRDAIAALFINELVESDADNLLAQTQPNENASVEDIVASLLDHYGLNDDEIDDILAILDTSETDATKKQQIVTYLTTIANDEEEQEPVEDPIEEFGGVKSSFSVWTANGKGDVSFTLSEVSLIADEIITLYNALNNNNKEALALMMVTKNNEYMGYARDLMDRLPKDVAETAVMFGIDYFIRNYDYDGNIPIPEVPGEALEMGKSEYVLEDGHSYNGNYINDIRDMSDETRDALVAVLNSNKTDAVKKTELKAYFVDENGEFGLPEKMATELAEFVVKLYNALNNENTTDDDLLNIFANKGYVFDAYEMLNEIELSIEDRVAVYYGKTCSLSSVELQRFAELLKTKNNQDALTSFINSSSLKTMGSRKILNFVQSIANSISYQYHSEQEEGRGGLEYSIEDGYVYDDAMIYNGSYNWSNVSTRPTVLHYDDSLEAVFNDVFEDADDSVVQQDPVESPLPPETGVALNIGYAMICVALVAGIVLVSLKRKEQY